MENCLIKTSTEFSKLPRSTFYGEKIFLHLFWKSVLDQIYHLITQAEHNECGDAYLFVSVTPQ